MRIGERRAQWKVGWFCDEVFGWGELKIRMAPAPVVACAYGVHCTSLLVTNDLHMQPALADVQVFNIAWIESSIR